jgi:membrane protein implicated in regulation of membrane protease activity
MSVLIAILLALFVLPAPWGLVAVAAAGALEVVEAWVFIAWSRRRRPAVGAETLVGKRAQAVSDLLPEGQVRLEGELWRARCERGARMGDSVVVQAVDSLTLVVEPV